MLKRFLCLLLVCLFPLFSLAEDAPKVFMDGETDPFPDGAELLTLRVCPLQGADCMLLTLGDHSMLVDAGRPVQISTVLDMLRKAELSSVEYLFNTHPHSDHIGGVIPLLDAGFGIGTFLAVFPRTYVEFPLEYDYNGETHRALEKAGVPVRMLKTEDTIPFGDAELTVLRIPDEYIRKDFTCNEMSAMLMIRYGDCSVLLTADVEPTKSIEVTLAELYDLDADILKYPHHGLSLVAREFLAEISPEAVVFTHGAGDSRRAQSQLIQSGISRMFFATWGMITLQTDGTRWIVRQDILPEMEQAAETYVYPQ